MYDAARDTFTSPDQTTPEDAEPNVQAPARSENLTPDKMTNGSETVPLKLEKDVSPQSQDSHISHAGDPSSHSQDQPLSPKTGNQIVQPRLAQSRKRKSGADDSTDAPISATSKSSHKKARTEAPKPSKRARSPRDDRTSKRRSRSPKSSRRSRSPDNLDRERRSSPRRRSPLPAPPTPPPRSPPRERKRPGNAARITQDQKDAIRLRRAREEEEAAAIAARRGVHDVVTQHYNLVPERGREWRSTGSQILGLRKFNNWVKSTIIQKFSPSEDFTPGAMGYGTGGGPQQSRLLVLDVGCGKGGDLGKWEKAPQQVELYVGVDPAEVSIDQARKRYAGMRNDARARRAPPPFDAAEFYAKDAFGEWLGDIPIIRDVGIDPASGPGAAGAASARWGGGGFDVVSMMFCMHYAFESEQKARGMLRNVAGSLKKGGRFLGVIPNSDIISAKVEEFHKKKSQAQTDGNTNGQVSKTPDGESEEVLEWGNSIYTVRFPGKTPQDGIFRPPFGWKYNYNLVEAVEAPEYVVPWEAFRALAEDYNLELQYRKPFTSIWDEEKNDPVLGPLSERMKVWNRDERRLAVSNDEMEAAGDA
ncbi:MAG: mRNA cap guanine-N7 methyltransferase [Candelina mexicana]|nr:MAG: mRNA cap guanine-N7 methyltransferase [Candelina mexicana]